MKTNVRTYFCIYQLDDVNTSKSLRLERVSLEALVFANAKQNRYNVWKMKEYLF